ncbi:MAG: peptide deformylase [Paludibacteraceae bacterium]
MILPIYTYGNTVLRKVAEPIDSNYPNLKELIQNMFDTMSHAEGIGLAAPQIGLPIRLLVIDLAPFKESDPEIADFKAIMINPEIIEESEETSTYDEGCLSVPGINETVVRPEKVVINYLDEDFNEHQQEFEGFKARVIQHEFDHLEGHLFTDRINPLRRQLIKSKLNNISKGKADCKYRIK